MDTNEPVIEVEENQDREETAIVPVNQENTWIKQHEAREAEREAIRDRHRMVREYEGIVYRHAKPMPSPMDDTEKAVAVYARVSTMSLNQTSSIENQEHYYEDKIQKTPNWHLTEIYSDEGKSGTSTKRREAFMRMMADARGGKFDMIVCASVSRFARNVSDCIDYVTELRTMNPSKPVGVYFETENLFTLNPDSEQTLGFHALLADWESGNKSRRMILSNDQRIFLGHFPVSDMLGYRHTKEGELVLVPEEAKTVKFIFLSFMAGYSADDIAEVLTEKQRSTLKGRTDWNGGMVRNVITNERRWGDLEARKTVVIDYKKKKTVKNNGIREGAFVPNHHEGIVTRGMAKAAKYMSGCSLSAIPRIDVIHTGTLKGFVSINPLWKGIDNDTLLNACVSVYTDEELEEIQQEARILSGEDSSKVLSYQFSGYQVPYGVYFMTQLSPALTVSRNGMKLSSSCHSKIKNCQTIEFLYHPILKTIAVRPTHRGNPNAIQWEKEDGGLITYFPTRSFSKAVYETLNWIEDYRFKFRGTTRERGNAQIMFFFLDEPRILVGKKAAPVDMDESNLRFIPYRKSEETMGEDGIVAYPGQWAENSAGMSIELRWRRDRITNIVSFEDIQQRGVPYEDPALGYIPSKNEILDELDALLESM